MLFPAAFMITLVLGALAIDAGVVFLHQRELAAAAGAAANDAATLALDEEHLRATGETRLNPEAVAAAVADSLDRRGILDELSEPPQVNVVAGTRVEITLVSHVDYVIAPALPGGFDGRTVRVTVSSTAVIDDGG